MRGVDWLAGAVALAVGAGGGLVVGCNPGVNDCSQYPDSTACHLGLGGGAMSSSSTMGTGGAPPLSCDGPPLAPDGLVGNIVDACAVFVSAASTSTAPDGTMANPYNTLADALAKTTSSRTKVFACTSKPFTEAVILAANRELYGGFDCTTTPAQWTWKATDRTELDGPADAVALTITGSGGRSAGVGAHDQGWRAERDAVEHRGGRGRHEDGSDDSAERHLGGEKPARQAGADADERGNGRPGCAGAESCANGCLHQSSLPRGRRPRHAGLRLCHDERRGGRCRGHLRRAPGRWHRPRERSARGRRHPVRFGDGRAGRPGADELGAVSGRHGGSARQHGLRGRRGEWTGDTQPLRSERWKRRSGGPGTPGQGGGGGGSAMSGVFCAGNAGGNGASGGGGGAGGCGGPGGTGGQAGGSSIAILSLGTKLSVDVETVTLTALAGGSGGGGALGQVGGAGGAGAAGGAAVGTSVAGCSGAKGGSGGQGGPSGGGLGGFSVGIAFASTPTKTYPFMTPPVTAEAAAGGMAAAGGQAGGQGVSGAICDFSKSPPSCTAM